MMDTAYWRAKMIVTDFKVIGKAYGEFDIVEVRCPICDGDEVEPLDLGYECANCGVHFKSKYKDTIQG
jgi:transposase-like protein